MFHEYKPLDVDGLPGELMSAFAKACQGISSSLKSTFKVGTSRKSSKSSSQQKQRQPAAADTAAADHSDGEEDGSNDDSSPAGSRRTSAEKTATASEKTRQSGSASSSFKSSSGSGGVRSQQKSSPFYSPQFPRSALHRYYDMLSPTALRKRTVLQQKDKNASGTSDQRNHFHRFATPPRDVWAQQKPVAKISPMVVQRKRPPRLLRIKYSGPTTVQALWQDEAFLRNYLFPYLFTATSSASQTPFYQNRYEILQMKLQSRLVCTSWNRVLESDESLWLSVTQCLNCAALQSSPQSWTRYIPSLRRRRIKSLCLHNLTDEDTIWIEEIFNKLSTEAAADERATGKRLDYNLKELYVRFSNITDEGMTRLLKIRAFSNIQLLHYECCNELQETGDACTLIKSLSSLTILDCINVTDETVNKFCEALVELESLHFQAYHVTDSALQTISKSLTNSLQELSLNSCWEVTNSGLYSLSHSMPQLRMVRLSGCSKISDEGVELIADGMPNLRVLDLSWCPLISDVSLESISYELNYIQELYLDRCSKITDLGVSFLSSTKSLKVLSLRWCSLLSNVSLRSISHLFQLQRLNVSGCQRLTIDGLRFVEPLILLEELEIVNCPRILAEEMGSIKALMPNKQCTVIH